MNLESQKRPHSFFIVHRSSFIIFLLLFSLFSLPSCSQEKKPFTNPKYYADPPAQAPIPAAIAPVAPDQTSQVTSVTSAPAVAGWTATVTDRAIPNNPELDESIWTIARPPHGQHDYIAVHRIAPAAEAGNSAQPVFFFLPGPHHHGDVVVADERYDLRLYLAKRGIQTWTLDYRTHFITREQIKDSRFMQAWTTQTFVEDALTAADFVRKTSGVQKIFVGGYSRGATFAVLMAARYSRQDVLGLIVLDGYVLDRPGTGTLYRQRRETPTWFADDLERRYVPYRRWMKMLGDTLAEPNGPDFLPAHIFENRSEMLEHFLFVSPTFGQKGGLSNAQGGYADILVLAKIFLHQDRYWPRVQNHGGFDLQRHLADAQFDYATALQALELPVIAFASSNMDKAGIAWAGRVEYTARAAGSTDVRYHLLRDWGHLDVLFGTAAAQQVFSPIADWIHQHTPSPAS